MTKDNNNVDNFLQSVCRFVSTEEKAQNIKDELKDHIESYIDEYTNDGMNIEDATLRALNQMGDPNSLSNEFKDDNSNNKRLLFSGIIIFFITIIISMDIYSYLNNTCSYMNILFNTIFIISNLFILNPVFKTYFKAKKLEKSSPIFYIQSYKKTICGERIFKYISYLVIFSIISILIDLDGFDFENLNLISTIFVNLIILITFNFNFQKNIIYPNGILTFDSFISWDNIDGYRWSKEHSKNKTLYYIELKLKSKFVYRKCIKVSSYQINLVDEVFKSKQIEKRNYF